MFLNHARPERADARDIIRSVFPFARQRASIGIREFREAGRLNHVDLQMGPQALAHFAIGLWRQSHRICDVSHEREVMRCSGFAGNDVNVHSTRCFRIPAIDLRRVWLPSSRVKKAAQVVHSHWWREPIHVPDCAEAPRARVLVGA